MCEWIAFVEKHLRAQWLFIAFAIHRSKTKFEICLSHWLIRMMIQEKKILLNKSSYGI